MLHSRPYVCLQLDIFAARRFGAVPHASHHSAGAAGIVYYLWGWGHIPCVGGIPCATVCARLIMLREQAPGGVGAADKASGLVSWRSPYRRRCAGAPKTLPVAPCDAAERAIDVVPHRCEPEKRTSIESSTLPIVGGAGAGFLRVEIGATVSGAARFGGWFACARRALPGPTWSGRRGGAAVVANAPRRPPWPELWAPAYGPCSTGAEQALPLRLAPVRCIPEESHLKLRSAPSVGLSCIVGSQLAPPPRPPGAAARVTADSWEKMDRSGGVLGRGWQGAWSCYGCLAGLVASVHARGGCVGANSISAAHQGPRYCHLFYTYAAPCSSP